MSKTTRLADSFQKKQAANYITRSFHGNQHGPPWYLSHGDLPHALKAGDQHGSQHGPPWYLSHGDLPHTLKAGNQHGNQHGSQHGSQHRPPRYLSHGDLPHTLAAGTQHVTNMDPHGTFPMVTSPIPWKLETNMEANMEPNMDPHGIFPMVTSPIPWQLEPNMEANMDPHGTFPMVTSPILSFFCSLLLFPSLSLFADVCWYLLSFHVACFFSLHCQVFCLLRLTLEGCPTNTEPNTYPKISHDLFLEMFWFQFFPHHRPGTWIVIKTWAQYEVKSRVARKSLTWIFQGKRLENHLGSRLTFKSPFKVADRFVITCSNSMLVVSGCSLGSVWAFIGFHVSFWVILLKKLVAWFPGEQIHLRPHHRFMLGDLRNSMQFHVGFRGCKIISVKIIKTCFLLMAISAIPL